MQELYWEWSQDQHLKGGCRGESQTNALAAEASANPTSFSGARVALQRCSELRQEDWALELLLDWLQAAPKAVASP